MIWQKNLILLRLFYCGYPPPPNQLIVSLPKNGTILCLHHWSWWTLRLRYDIFDMVANLYLHEGHRIPWFGWDFNPQRSWSYNFMVTVLPQIRAVGCGSRTPMLEYVGTIPHFWQGQLAMASCIGALGSTSTQFLHPSAKIKEKWPNDEKHHVEGVIITGEGTFKVNQ